MDTVILAPSSTTTPMRMPEDRWAMLVVAVDVVSHTDPDREDDIVLFAGVWVAEQPSAEFCDGDLVVVLTAPEDESSDSDVVNVELLLAHEQRWRRVGFWALLDAHWPWTTAPTVAAIIELHTDASEVDTSPSVTASPSPTGLRGYAGNGGIVDLLAAGLVRPGDEFCWDRPALGVCHTARINPDGRLRLADGQSYRNPSGATTALGGNHQNGWVTWKRTSDGVSLGDLRATLRTRLSLPSDVSRKK
ncbi:hypothetical protein DFQ13_116120 [Actinokineospora spheciospongiae]|nr:hypothetical protein DFQ13_116120 [Actinokineospora spheciospongiae]